MPKGVNKVILLGHLGKSAETKFTPTGVSVSNFSLATSRRVKDGDQWADATEWHRVTVWQSEPIANYLLKGKQIYLEGRLQTRSYESNGVKHWITEVVCNAGDVNLLGGGDKQAQPPTPATDDDIDGVPF